MLDAVFPLPRRTLLAGSIALIATPSAVRAQSGERVSRVGFLSATSAASAASRANVAAFLERFAELGWTQGRNFKFETRFAETKYERLDGLAADLVRLPVDVIFANSAPAAAAAKRATAAIPIVFETLGDPVTVGLVDSLARPGRNLTGVSGLGPELSGKRLELLREAVPGLRRVFILVNPGNAMARPTLRETQRAAAVLGLKLETLEARTPSDLEGALARLHGDGASGVVVMPDSMLLGEAARIQGAFLKHRLAAIHNETGWDQAGALLRFGSSLRDHFRQSAELVDKILRGARPADLPVQQSTKFELVINLRTAKAIGLTIPPSVLLRADRVLE